MVAVHNFMFMDSRHILTLCIIGLNRE